MSPGSHPHRHGAGPLGHESLLVLLAALLLAWLVSMIVVPPAHGGAGTCGAHGPAPSAGVAVRV